jgi:hypothetical protein
MRGKAREGEREGEETEREGNNDSHGGEGANG